MKQLDSLYSQALRSQSQGVATWDDINLSLHLQHTGNHSGVNLGCEITSNGSFGCKMTEGICDVILSSELAKWAVE